MAKLLDSENQIVLSGLVMDDPRTVQKEAFGVVVEAKLLLYRRTRTARGYQFSVIRVLFLHDTGIDVMRSVRRDSHLRVRGEIRATDRGSSIDVIGLGWAELQPAAVTVDEIMMNGVKE